MEEQDIKDLLKQSKLEIQFPNFEDLVMDKIKAKEANRRSVWKNLKISWIFFFIGSFFGILVAQLLADIQIPFLGENSKLVLLVGEILIVFIVASHFDRLLRFTFKKRD